MQQKQEDLAAKVSTKRWPLCCLLSHIILSNLRLTKAKFCQIPGYELMGCDALFFAMGQCLLRHQFGQQPLCTDSAALLHVVVGPRLFRDWILQ